METTTAPTAYPVKALAPRDRGQYWTARWKMSDGSIKYYTGSRADRNNRLCKAQAIGIAEAIVAQAQQLHSTIQ